MTARPILFSIALLCAVLSSCVERTVNAPEPWRPHDLVLGVQPSASPLVGTNWSLRSLTDTPLDAAPDSLRLLRFMGDASRSLELWASLGCNALGGTADTVGTRLRVERVFSTRIYCGEPLTSLETRYATLLGTVAYFGVRGDTLWLYDRGFQLQARYLATP